jgi:hypothetical protein
MFDGTRKLLEEEQSVIDQVIDHHAIFQSLHCDIAHSYPEYLEHVRQLLEDGCKVDILELKMHEKGVEYSVRLTIPGKEPIVIRAVGAVDNGKIVSVEPVENAEAKKSYVARYVYLSIDLGNKLLKNERSDMEGSEKLEGSSESGSHVESYTTLGRKCCIFAINVIVPIVGFKCVASLCAYR